MDLNIISYSELLTGDSYAVHGKIANALLTKGIIGLSEIPGFKEKRQDYIQAARQFAALPATIKNQYAPDRDSGQTEGYELGAEWFQSADGKWQKDDKKASFYALVPDQPKNIWPREINLKTPYQALGELIFQTGKRLLSVIGLDERIALFHDRISGYGRMLHYYKEDHVSAANANWCGAHFDHGIFTGLISSVYFKDGVEVPEPEEAGLYIIPTGKNDFIKISAGPDVLLFQVGEFGQLISHDRIRATKHCVKKAGPGIERFTFALFYSPEDSYRTVSQSQLIHDERYAQQQAPDGGLTYQQWANASYERYRAR